MTASNVFIFWTACDELWARLIIRITGRAAEPQKSEPQTDPLTSDLCRSSSDAWSHMGIVFRLSPDLTSDPLTSGTLVYYEALLSYGFTGPQPLAKLQSWAEKRGNRLCILPTSISGAAAEEIRLRCETWVGRLGYFDWQLAGMWFFERIGRHIGLHLPRSPEKLVCSEAVARLVFPALDLRDDVRQGFDEVNPASAFRKYQLLKAENGGFTP